MAIEILTFILLIVGAIVLSTGKGSFFIAGFNTLSKEKKEKYDTELLSKFVGKVLFVASISTLLSILSSALKIEVLSTIGFILALLTVCFALVYLNTNNRFTNNKNRKS